MFQGEGTSNSQLSSNKDENKQKSKKKSYLCSKEYWFKDCPYLIEFLHSKDWKPDPSVQIWIDEKLKIQLLKQAVKQAQKHVQKLPKSLKS